MKALDKMLTKVWLKNSEEWQNADKENPASREEILKGMEQVKNLVDEISQNPDWRKRFDQYKEITTPFPKEVYTQEGNFTYTWTKLNYEYGSYSSDSNDWKILLMWLNGKISSPFDPSWPDEWTSSSAIAREDKYNNKVFGKALWEIGLSR